MCNYKNYILITFCFILLINAWGQGGLKIEDTTNYKKIDAKKFKAKDTLKQFGQYYHGIDRIDSILIKEGRDTMLIATYSINDLTIKKNYYYLNGKIKDLFVFADDTIKWRSFFQTGELKSRNVMVNMVYHHSIYFLKSGSLDFEEFQYKDSTLSRAWFPNGNLKTEWTQHYEKEWCEDGRQILFAQNNNGRFKRIKYWCNGNKSEEYTYINSKLYLIGKVNFWYENGVKMSEKYYKEGNNWKESNIAEGLWKYWNEKGAIIKKEWYKDGVLVNKKEFFPTNGNISK